MAQQMTEWDVDSNSNDNNDTARGVEATEPHTVLAAPLAADVTEPWVLEKTWETTEYWRRLPPPRDELVNPYGMATSQSWNWQTSEPQSWEYQQLPHEAATNWGAVLQEIAETAVLTLLIFVMMRALIQNYRIEGYSMEPNLHEQQYLIVNKVAYYFDEPQRGDIIVFEYPNSDPNGPEKDYIKRIIGLPGDTVECRPNEILVNGEVIAEPYGPNEGSYYCSPTTLSADEYFVLGDNRNQSSDSHSWGPLERKFIIGKAWLLYWPVDDMGLVPTHRIEAPPPTEPLVRTP